MTKGAERSQSIANDLDDRQHWHRQDRPGNAPHPVPLRGDAEGEPMPAERVPMRCVREILRLKYGCGATDRMIARSTGLARSTVGDYLNRATAAGLSWPLPPRLTEAALEAMLFARAGIAAGTRRKAEPDWPAIHRSPPTQWPTSDRNRWPGSIGTGGRLQIGISGRHHFGIGGRHHFGIGGRLTSE